MGSRDADPKLLFFKIKGSLHRFSGFPACDAVGSTLKKIGSSYELAETFLRANSDFQAVV